MPPPRTLLSPLGGVVGRRATSLKTKEGAPKKEELRKVVRASSTAHRSNKPFTGAVCLQIPRELSSVSGMLYCYIFTSMFNMSRDYEYVWHNIQCWKHRTKLMKMSPKTAYYDGVCTMI